MSDSVPRTPPPSYSGIKFQVEYRRSRHFDVSDLCRQAIERHSKNERPVIVSFKGKFLIADDHSSKEELKSALILACQEIYKRCQGNSTYIDNIYAQTSIDPDGDFITAIQIKTLYSLLGE